MEAAQRIERMRAALEMGKEPLRLRPPNDGWLSIVGYGPSLRDTWQAVTHPMVTCSGAHDFMISRGVVPNWHAESDPWPPKAMFTQNSHKDVTYLIASCCDPQIWENVKERKSLIWHCGEPETQQWIKDHDPSGMITGFGTTIGERCVELGMILGYRKFKFFGIDCSFTDEQRAGPHRGGKHEEIEIELPEFGSFKTSHAMLYSARTLINALLREGSECEIYGNGLARALFTRALRRREAKSQGLGAILPRGNMRAA